MQFQIQEYAKRSDKDTLNGETSKKESATKELDSLDLYVSLKSGLDDPFTIFIRVQDIVNKSPNLYFYAYSIGTKKLMIWGIYDSVNNHFLIDHSCRYNPTDLKTILDIWKSHQYDFYYTTVRNRSASRIYQNFVFEDRNKELRLMATLRNYFMAKLIRSGVLSPTALDINTGSSNGDPVKIKELINMEAIDYDSYYYNMMREISRKGLEALCNEYSNEITSKYKDMMNLIYNNMEFSKDVDTVKDILADCKLNKFDKINSAKNNTTTDYVLNIIKYSLTNIYIIVFLEMEDYRIAKYIDYISNKDNGGQNANSDTENIDKIKKLRSYIVGKFLYEWILELARILRVDDNKSFMKEYVKIITNHTEKSINEIGEVIGAKRTLASSPELEKMSVFFEDFISKSEYSKISIVNNIEMCPKSDVCEFGNEEACGLYNFGSQGMNSKHDLL